VTLPVGIPQVIEGRFINTYVLAVFYYFYHYYFEPPLSCEVRFIALFNIRLIRVANYCVVCMSSENSFLHCNLCTCNSVADFKN
jgi:hypothetical protein